MESKYWINCYQFYLLGVYKDPPGTAYEVNCLIIESIKSAERAVYKKKYQKDIIITGDFKKNNID